MPTEAPVALSLSVDRKADASHVDMYKHITESIVAVQREILNQGLISLTYTATIPNTML